MNPFDDEPARVSILGVVGRLTCTQENEVYLRLLKVPEYIEANTIDRVLTAAEGNRMIVADDLWRWARRRSGLAAVLAPIVAKLMAEVTR